MPLSSVPLFYREFIRSFKTTGAILPSGKALAKALVSPIEEISGQRLILEAGPGTGAVTTHLLKYLRKDDQLILCEINPQFADYLEKRLVEDPQWQPYRNQVQLIREDVRKVIKKHEYDFILSGLPLNNFTPTLVEEILGGFLNALTGRGVHTFFEYILVRELRMRVGTQGEKERMSGIHQIVQSKLEQMKWQRSAILWNVPPAWAYAVRNSMDPAANPTVPRLAGK